MPKRLQTLVIAVTAPVLLQIFLEVFFRWLPWPDALTHGFSVALINVLVVGGFCFFRAFRPPAAAAFMVVYVPGMMVVMFAAMSGFAWFAYGDAL
jgi:hypothetical protein